MEYWQAFQQFEYSNETLMVVGAFIVFIGLLQILKSSMKLMFWVVLVAVGASAAFYGYDKSAVRFPAHLADEVRALAGPGGALSDGMMQALCLKVLRSEEDTTSSELRSPSSSVQTVSGTQ